MGSTHYGILKNLWDNVPGVGWWLVFFVSLIIYSNVVNGLWRNDKTRTAGYWLKGLFWTFWGLLLLWKFGLFGNWLNSEQMQTSLDHAQEVTSNFSWLKFFIRAILTVVICVLFWFGSKGLGNLFVDKRYLSSDGEKVSTITSFSGLTILCLLGLFIVWIPGFYFWKFLIFCLAYWLSGTNAVPLKEVWVPALFDQPMLAGGDDLSREKEIKILSTGLFTSLIPLWFIGLKLIRLRNDVEVINNHVIPDKLSTKESTRKSLAGSDSADDDANIVGPRVTVSYNLEFEYNEYPGKFLNISDEDQHKLQGSVLAKVDSLVKSKIQGMVYQEVEQWHPDKNDEFFVGLSKALRALGVYLQIFEVVNISSVVEEATDELAAQRARMQMEVLSAETAAKTTIMAAEAAARARVIEGTAIGQSFAAMVTAYKKEHPGVSQEQAEAHVRQLQLISKTGSVNIVAPGLNTSFLVDPNQQHR